MSFLMQYHSIICILFQFHDEELSKRFNDFTRMSVGEVRKAATAGKLIDLQAANLEFLHQLPCQWSPESTRSGL